jgi:hypothetical protein
MPERVADVDHILERVPRQPQKFATEEDYGNYLFQATTPVIFTDNISGLTENIFLQGAQYVQEELAGKSIEELKDIYSEVLIKKLEQIVSQQRDNLRTYKEYDDIQEIFDRIRASDIADPALFLNGIHGEHLKCLMME